MKPDLNSIKELAKAHYPTVLETRRHLHQHPELSFKEFQTSEYIKKKLREADIAFTFGHVRTGILALIRGKNPDKKTILLRADMDALPIHEKNEVPYRSQNEGVMHACGHDVHSACALGAALMLQDMRDQFEGTVKIMFQPGEEVLPGGARLMIKEGALNNPKVDNAIALHVFPEMETGMVGFKPGMYMASTDELYATVSGKGGHAAMPAAYNNPLLAASAFLLKVQETFMKEGALKGTIGETIPTVVAFGKIEGLGATNVIPEQVQLAGTFRTMNEDWRAQVHTHLNELAKEIAAQYNLTIELRVEHGYPFLVNNEDFTNNCMSAAKDLLGDEMVKELPTRMTAEDFAFISQKVPSCFFRLGTGNTAKGISSGVHTATFDVDESSLLIGMQMLTWLAVSELHRS
jgi:amidohydrolase